MKRLLSWLLAALMLLTMLPTSGWADDTASGTCGENLTWTLSSDGVLTISGTGDMTDYSSLEDVPWREYDSSIRRAVLCNGVTNIGSYTFAICVSLKEIRIPEGVTNIGEMAFFACQDLASVAIPDSVVSIGRAAFSSCTSLTSVTIPNSVTSIGNSAFIGCSDLTSVPTSSLSPWKPGTDIRSIW